MKIRVEEWGILPIDQPMNTYYLRQMLETYRNEKGVTFYFSKGTYHFYPDYAVEKLLYISNHDEDTIKKIAFDFSDFEEVSLCGEETEFIFHTDILPFYIHRCKGFNIEGIRIDYARPAYSEGEILSVAPRRMEVRIDKEKYPYYILHDRIFFKGENFCHEITNGCLEMDGTRLSPVYEGHDIGFNRSYKQSYHAAFKELEENIVEITLLDENQKFLSTSKVGNRMIFRHHMRTHPAFYITNSQDVVCKDIIIYHCTGMAVISQFTKNIHLEQFHILMHPEKKRIFTATADGFHFVYCTGQLHIKDCKLENQLDDPVNIHGIYGRIHKKLSETEFIVELVEGMQKGVQLGQKGERFAILNNETMLEEAESTLEHIEMLNRDFMYMRFSRAIVACKEGYVVENKEYVPNVLIEGCLFRNNRARGLLLTSAGQVIVRKNVFQNAGAAILIEGDSNYWFESGGTNYISVCDNQFIDCAYVSDWGAAPIQVSPSARTCVEGKRYHKYLEVKNNEFWCFDDRIMNARHIEKIVFKDNIIHKTETFPPLSGENFVLEEVLDFIEENTIKQ